MMNSTKRMMNFNNTKSSRRKFCENILSGVQQISDNYNQEIQRYISMEMEKISKKSQSSNSESSETIPEISTSETITMPQTSPMIQPALQQIIKPKETIPMPQDDILSISSRVKDMMTRKSGIGRITEKIYSGQLDGIEIEDLKQFIIDLGIKKPDTKIQSLFKGKTAQFFVMNGTKIMMNDGLWIMS